MKKLIYFVIAAFALTACREDPDLGDLSNDFLVFTNYDQSVDFNKYPTYYMPDSVMLISDKEQPEYWTGTKAEPILEAYADNMKTMGYTRIADKEQATLGLQISYVESISYFTEYHEPYWWNGYPGYWGPGYWGNWDHWYYPYAVVYTYSVGSLLTELVDLQAPQGDAKKLPVVWNSFMSGLLSGSQNFNMLLTVRAINQSFIQSPYLDRNMSGN